MIRPSVIIITESWLTEFVSDNQISLPNYSIPFRKDRCDGRRGGGVAVFVHEALSTERVVSLNATNYPVEDIWLMLPSVQLLVIALYIPPNLQSKTMECIDEKLSDGIERVLEQRPNVKVIVAGDLNNFPTRQIQESFNLAQVVTNPTRGDNILDKILIEESLTDAYKNVVVGPSLGNSDHRSVHMTAGNSAPVLYTIKNVYDFRHSYIESFRCFLRAYPWHSLFLSQIGAEEKCNAFYDVIKAATALIPPSEVPFTQKDKVWITPLVKSMINKRYAAYRRKDFVMYNHYKQKVKLLIEESKNKWLQSTKASANGLWKICRDALNLSKSATLSSLIRSFPSPTEAAEKINEEFCKHFSATPDWDTLLTSLNTDNSEDWAPNVSERCIAKHLKNLKVNKAPGNDGLPPRLLSEAYIELAPPICHLISISIQETVVPSKWKFANVTPIPKKRNPSLKDLRPVSILPTVSKVLEKCVLASVKERLVDLYGPLQFGFRPHCSTEMAHIITSPRVHHK